MAKGHEAEAEGSRRPCASAVGVAQTIMGWRGTEAVAENPTKGMQGGRETGRRVEIQPAMDLK